MGSCCLCLVFLSETQHAHTLHLLADVQQVKVNHITQQPQHSGAVPGGDTHPTQPAGRL
uniref:Uncharacterized protein n=1 Tax=Anguilla anguilla TaxID=7936 RepID=A0A0E9QL94_ANGAN